MDNLIQLAQGLAVRRKRRDEIAKRCGELTDLTEKLPLVIELEKQVALLGETSDAIRAIEVTLREATVKYHQSHPDQPKAYDFGRIGEYTTLDYQDAQAFDWAKEHNLALKLDKPAFNKIAKASPPDFVEVGKEVRFNINSNLTPMLEGDTK